MKTPDLDERGTVAEGRRARKARATRRALLDAGLAAFERQSPSLVSVLDITETADVAKGVFYLHFASKDQFLIALWEDVQFTFLDSVRQAVDALPSSPDASPDQLRQARIEAAIEQYAHAAAHNGRAVCFALRMASYIGEEIGPPGELVRRREAYLNALADAIAGGASESAACMSDRDVARILDACCWGMIWHALTLEAEPPTAMQLTEIVLGGIERLQSRVPSR